MRNQKPAAWDSTSEFLSLDATSLNLWTVSSTIDFYNKFDFSISDITCSLPGIENEDDTSLQHPFFYTKVPSSILPKFSLNIQELTV